MYFDKAVIVQLTWVMPFSSRPMSQRARRGMEKAVDFRYGESRKLLWTQAGFVAVDILFTNLIKIKKMASISSDVR